MMTILIRQFVKMLLVSDVRLPAIHRARIAHNPGRAAHMRAAMTVCVNAGTGN